MDADEELEAAGREFHRFAARRAFFVWARGERCRVCDEWIGHFGGSVDRDPCSMIPSDVPLEEIRRNCYEVLRPHIGDAIRKACKS